MDEDKDKQFSCKICGRAIRHKGNCLLCNLKLKNHTPVMPKESPAEKGDLEAAEDLEALEELRKEIMDEDYYGDRLLLRRKQTGNEDFRRYVLERYGNKCFFCNINKEHLNVHHLVYDKKCKFFKTKNEGKKHTQRQIADCERCRKESKEIFEDCMSLVIPLCYACHEKLHKIMKKSFGQWVPPKK